MNKTEDKIRAISEYSKFFRQGPPIHNSVSEEILKQNYLELARAIGGIDLDNKYERIKKAILNHNQTPERFNKEKNKAFNRGDLQLGTLFHLVGESISHPKKSFKEIIEELEQELEITGAYYLNIPKNESIEDIDDIRTIINPKGLEKAIFLDFDGTLTDQTQEDNKRRNIDNFLKELTEDKRYLHLITSAGFKIDTKIKNSFKNDYEKIKNYLDAVFAIPGIVKGKLSGKLYGGLIDYLNLKPKQCIIIGDTLKADKPYEKFYENRVVQLVTTPGISAKKWTQTISLLEQYSEGKGFPQVIKKIQQRIAGTITVNGISFVKYDVTNIPKKEIIVDLYGHPDFKNALIMTKKYSEPIFPTH